MLITHSPATIADNLLLVGPILDRVLHPASQSNNILLFTIPVNVVMAQELVPSQAGTISALMMGFAWGAAGVIFIPLTGWLADLTSLHHALSALVIFPIVGFFLTLKLPRDTRHA